MFFSVIGAIQMRYDDDDDDVSCRVQYITLLYYTLDSTNH